MSEEDKKIINKIADKIEEIDEVIEVRAIASARDYLINDNLRIEAEIKTEKEDE